MAHDEALAARVAQDYTKAALTPRERAMADYAVKVTRAPQACSPQDLDALRQAGLSDADIVSLVEIVVYYNMSNRLMESLSTVEE